MSRSVLTIYLGGVPASGKSTILRRVRQNLFADAEPFQFGTARGVASGAFVMLGVFDGSMFEGTDKLSMSVINDALAFIRKLEGEGRRRVVLVEGDRLLCERFLRETGARLLVVEASPNALATRRARRSGLGHTQSETFLKAKRTKVSKLALAFHASVMTNNSRAELERNAASLVAMAKKWVG